MTALLHAHAFDPLPRSPLGPVIPRRAHSRQRASAVPAHATAIAEALVLTPTIRALSRSAPRGGAGHRCRLSCPSTTALCASFPGASAPTTPAQAGAPRVPPPVRVKNGGSGLGLRPHHSPATRSAGVTGAAAPAAPRHQACAPGNTALLTGDESRSQRPATRSVGVTGADAPSAPSTAPCTPLDKALLEQIQTPVTDANLSPIIFGASCEATASTLHAERDRPAMVDIPRGLGGFYALRRRAHRHRVVPGAGGPKVSSKSHRRTPAMVNGAGRSRSASLGSSIPDFLRPVVSPRGFGIPGRSREELPAPPRVPPNHRESVIPRQRVHPSRLTVCPRCGIRGIDGKNRMAPSKGDGEDLMDLKEAAKLIGVAPSTLHRWVVAGKVRHLRVGPHRLRFRREDIEALTRVVDPDATGADDAPRGEK